MPRYPKRPDLTVARMVHRSRQQGIGGSNTDSAERVRVGDLLWGGAVTGRVDDTQPSRVRTLSDMSDAEKAALEAAYGAKIAPPRPAEDDDEAKRG